MTSPVLKRSVPVLAGLVVVLVACAWLSLGVGPSGATWSDVPDLLGGTADPTTRDILLRVRLPRLILAALVGAALSGAGVVFQAVLRNPLADPYILGVSGGAALGAVLFTSVVGNVALGSALGRPGARSSPRCTSQRLRRSMIWATAAATSSASATRRSWALVSSAWGPPKMIGRWSMPCTAWRCAVSGS